MKVSNVLSFMNLQYTLRGCVDYAAAQSLSSFDIDWISPQPTDIDYHVSASILQGKIILEACEDALQNYLDTSAQEKGYDGSVSCAGYALSTNAQWKLEAETFIAWRDLCWMYAIDISNQVANNEIEVPSVSQFLANAPVLAW